MRLWHKDLIPYLPKQQLLGQWRELNSIYKLQNRHVLINFVYNYPKEHLFYYSELIMQELDKRLYKYNDENFLDYFYPNGLLVVSDVSFSEIFKDKMTERYLKQCLYNLQEKHDCGGISDEEWKVIADNFDID